MTAAPTLPQTDCPAAAPEASGAVPDRQLQLLGELAEIGLEIARALEGQAKGTAPRLVEGDIVLAYARVSRAVRLTLMLQARLIEDMQAPERAARSARAAADAEWVRANPEGLRPTPELQRKVRVEKIVERLVEAEHPDNEEALESLMGEACERLDDDDRYGDILQRPMSEIVARLCNDLGLDPDWAGLAKELWAVREVESGDIGWPFTEFATSPASSDREGPPKAVKRAQRPSERRQLNDALSTLDGIFQSDTG